MEIAGVTENSGFTWFTTNFQIQNKKNPQRLGRYINHSLAKVHNLRSASTQTYSGKLFCHKSNHYWNLKYIKNVKIPNSRKHLFWMSVASCCSMWMFLYGPFCHGALKLDMPTLFTTFFLLTSLQFLYSHVCFRLQQATALLGWEVGDQD